MTASKPRQTASRVWIAGVLTAATLAWAVFAWAGFVALGLLIGDSGIGSVGVLDLLFVLTLFLLVPIGLVLAWSFLLQGRPPTARQFRAGAMLVLVLAAVVGLFALWATLHNLSN
jgi:hypothetical protein